MAALSHTRRVPQVDARVLGELAQRGRWFVRLPADEPWLVTIDGVGDDPRKRLNQMVQRGTLKNISRGLWVVVPDGATPERLGGAYPIEMLLSAVMEQHGQPWYVGCITAMAELGLTDETPTTLVVLTKGEKQIRVPDIEGRDIHVVNVSRDDSWDGVDRVRLRGRTFTHRSGVERTLLDTLEYPRLCGPPEVWVRAWERAMREERVNLTSLMDLSEQRAHIVRARLAFWLAETGHPREARYVLATNSKRPSGKPFLDSSQSYDGDWHRDPLTGLIVNIPRSSIDGWLTYGK